MLQKTVQTVEVQTTYLQKHSEQDDNDGGCDKELLASNGVGESEGQGE